MNRALTDAFSAALPLLGGSTRHVVRTVERRTNVAFEMPWKSAPAQAPAAGRGRKPERTVLEGKAPPESLQRQKSSQPKSSKKQTTVPASCALCVVLLYLVLVADTRASVMIIVPLS